MSQNKIPMKPADSNEDKQNVQLLTNDMLIDYIEANVVMLLAIYHPLKPRWERLCPIFEQVRATTDLGRVISKTSKQYMADG